MSEITAIEPSAAKLRRWAVESFASLLGCYVGAIVGAGASLGIDALLGNSVELQWLMGRWLKCFLLFILIKIIGKLFQLKFFVALILLIGSVLAIFITFLAYAISVGASFAFEAW